MNSLRHWIDPVAGALTVLLQLPIRHEIQSRWQFLQFPFAVYYPLRALLEQGGRQWPVASCNFLSAKSGVIWNNRATWQVPCCTDRRGWTWEIKSFSERTWSKPITRNGRLGCSWWKPQNLTNRCVLQKWSRYRLQKIAREGEYILVAINGIPFLRNLFALFFCLKCQFSHSLVSKIYTDLNCPAGNSNYRHFMECFGQGTSRLMKSHWIRENYWSRLRSSQWLRPN